MPSGMKCTHGSQEEDDQRRANRTEPVQSSQQCNNINKQMGRVGILVM